MNKTGNAGLGHQRVLDETSGVVAEDRTVRAAGREPVEESCSHGDIADSG